MKDKRKFKNKLLSIFFLPALLALFLLFVNYQFLSEMVLQDSTQRFQKIKFNNNDFDSMDVYALHYTPYYWEEDFPFHIVIKYDIARYINKYIDIKNIDNYETEDKDTLKSFSENIDSNVIIYWELWKENRMISNSYSNNKNKDVLLDCDLYDQNSKHWRELQDSDYTLTYYFNEEIPINKNYFYKLKYKVKYNSHIFDTNNAYIGYEYDRWHLTGIASGKAGGGGKLFQLMINYIGLRLLILMLLVSPILYYLFVKEESSNKNSKV